MKNILSNFKMDSKEIIKELNSFSKNRIHDREDLKRVIDIALKSGGIDLLDSLAFKAKFINSLLKIIKSRNDEIDEAAFGNIKNEYIISINEFKDQLLASLKNEGSDFIKDIFEKKYFSLTHESMNNLNKLCSDLSWVKLYLNDRKRGKIEDRA